MKIKEKINAQWRKINEKLPITGKIIKYGLAGSLVVGGLLGLSYFATGMIASVQAGALLSGPLSSIIAGVFGAIGGTLATAINIVLPVSLIAGVSEAVVNEQRKSKQSAPQVKTKNDKAVTEPYTASLVGDVSSSLKHMANYASNAFKQAKEKVSHEVREKTARPEAQPVEKKDSKPSKT